MKYPNFIKEKQAIGICAPSAGVGRKIDDFNASLDVLRDAGYQIKETKSVRVNDVRSADSKTRAAEFHELLEDDDVKLIGFAAGGDYMLEMLGDVDFELVKKYPKWMMGASDPTNLLFPITAGLDIATLYGYNAGSYGSLASRCDRDNLEILKGNIVDQENYGFYQTFLDGIMGNDIVYPVNWKCEGTVKFEGRLIGGCFDVIANLMGTPFDHVGEFVERYKDEGIVWFFDNFAKNAYDFYLILLQMKYAGYFKCCKGVMIGRHAFPNEENMTYLEALERVFEDIPYVYDMDIGHTFPYMTLVNGSYVNLEASDGKGKLKQCLK